VQYLPLNIKSCSSSKYCSDSEILSRILSDKKVASGRMSTSRYLVSLFALTSRCTFLLLPPIASNSSVNKERPSCFRFHCYLLPTKPGCLFSFVLLQVTSTYPILLWFSSPRKLTPNGLRQFAHTDRNLVPVVVVDVSGCTMSSLSYCTCTRFSGSCQQSVNRTETS
jgi:hypothetical protein